MALPDPDDETRGDNHREPAVPLSQHWMLNNLRPLVLLYHGVPRRPCTDSVDAKSFEEQIRFLKRRCIFIHPEEYQERHSDLCRPAVLLTFDDGLRNNAEVVAPILQKHKIPAIFFISSMHATPGKYLWFTYLRMLNVWFRGDHLLLNGEVVPHVRHKYWEKSKISERLLRLRPHPGAMYDCIASMPPLEDFVPPSVIADECEGISPEQVGQLAADPLFTIGSHTADHPYLTLCDPAELMRQVHDNKMWIEQLTGRKCSVFAYPGGLFDAKVLSYCRREFDKAFAVEWSTISDAQFGIQRIGIHSKSLLRLGIKLFFGRWLPYEHVEPLRKLVHVFAAH